MLWQYFCCLLHVGGGGGMKGLGDKWCSSKFECCKAFSVGAQVQARLQADTTASPAVNTTCSSGSNCMHLHSSEWTSQRSSWCTRFGESCVNATVDRIACISKSGGQGRFEAGEGCSKVRNIAADHVSVFKCPAMGGSKGEGGGRPRDWCAQILCSKIELRFAPEESPPPLPKVYGKN